VAEASDFSLRCPNESHQSKGHPIGENVVAMDFILSLAEGAVAPGTLPPATLVHPWTSSMPLCQCAASLPRLIDDEMHLNHSPMMGPILEARFLYMAKPALNMILGGVVIPFAAM